MFYFFFGSSFYEIASRHTQYTGRKEGLIKLDLALNGMYVIELILFPSPPPGRPRPERTG